MQEGCYKDEGRRQEGSHRDAAGMSKGCHRGDAAGKQEGCCMEAGGVPEGCCRDMGDAAGMQGASCRTLSHGSLTSKECLALMLTQTSYFISPETFRRKQVFISLETQAADAGCLGGASSSCTPTAALLVPPAAASAGMRCRMGLHPRHRADGILYPVQLQTMVPCTMGWNTANSVSVS